MQLYNAHISQGCSPSLYIARRKFKLAVPFSLDKLSLFCETRDALILTGVDLLFYYLSCKVANTGLRKWYGHSTGLLG